MVTKNIHKYKRRDITLCGVSIRNDCGRGFSLIWKNITCEDCLTNKINKTW